MKFCGLPVRDSPLTALSICRRIDDCSTQPLVQNIIDVGEAEKLCRGAVGPQHLTEIAAQHCHGIALGKVIANGSMDRKIDERIMMCLSMGGIPVWACVSPSSGELRVY
ncbi:hypothetical protein OEG86_07800 [Hoeflea alexandrii]|nr:hypothetical protein [Hoeflea alexandrii]